MKRYKDLSGNSGVAFYETGADAIIIQFTTGTVYVYNYSKPGKKHVEQMKLLAATGKGLSTYINQHVRDNYAQQLS